MFFLMEGLYLALGISTRFRSLSTDFELELPEYGEIGLSNSPCVDIHMQFGQSKP
ncbi:hypothetical protein DSO57_1030673 [Entomophthora muscae]|uniref:Uncharacterized protein n=1 Tax=Entomophthora muscae TaxID=34485 RepID=A0ACC2RFI4_9FUNG|nr:hypothetical protein DSO57_1030673 [Entomophthora muscae]